VQCVRGEKPCLDLPPANLLGCMLAWGRFGRYSAAIPAFDGVDPSTAQSQRWTTAKFSERRHGFQAPGDNQNKHISGVPARGSPGGWRLIRPVETSVHAPARCPRPTVLTRSQD
jgi:hypothetical protein